MVAGEYFDDKGMTKIFLKQKNLKLMKYPTVIYFSRAKKIHFLILYYPPDLYVRYGTVPYVFHKLEKLLNT